jgi:hypothetical protein
MLVLDHPSRHNRRGADVELDSGVDAMTVEFEFADGSSRRHTGVLDHDQAWRIVRVTEREGLEIVSAWRDEEPWFGLCTDMREGQP